MNTDNNGNYTFSNIPGGKNYHIRPFLPKYEFSPTSRICSNLHYDYTEQDFIGYLVDSKSPETYIISGPSGTVNTGNVTFEWTASDDISATSNLVYSYILERYDNTWSNWSAETSKSYSLPNGEYIFKVKAKDEAENEDGTPAERRFIVNSDPQLVSSEHSNSGIWVSKIRVKANSDYVANSGCIVLTKKDAHSQDEGLIPLEVHHPGDTSIIGAHEYIADYIGVPSLISNTNTGFKFIIPDDIPAGGEKEYEIVWGKIIYFGTISISKAIGSRPRSSQSSLH